MMNTQLVEIGWVLAGRLDPVDLEAVLHARTRMQTWLQEHFPGFEWKMPIVQRKEIVIRGPVPPVTLIDHGAFERDTWHWDFALVVTEADLKTFFKPYALGTPAKAVNIAVLSTARIDPAAFDESDRAARTGTMSQRVMALAMHLFGHLNDLPHASDPSDFMFDFKTIQDLDAPHTLSEDGIRSLREQLEEEADVRLEERYRFNGKALFFYLHFLVLGGLDILRTVFNARPWLFPLRLSRLTTAAASTMVVLLITAEAWDLGMSQPAMAVIVLSLVALFSTSAYIVKRQQLLVRRRRRHLSEQRVISNVSIAVSVLLGMTTTYLLLFGTTLLLSNTLFGRHLVEGWALSLDGKIGLREHLKLSGFVASLGLLIGALGASFEEQGYFRHVTYVDEET